MVAVAPTLDARSQVSLSVRAIMLLDRVAVRYPESPMSLTSSSSGSSKPLAANASAVERVVTCQPCEDR